MTFPTRRQMRKNLIISEKLSWPFRVWLLDLQQPASQPASTRFEKKFLAFAAYFMAGSYFFLSSCPRLDPWLLCTVRIKWARATCCTATEMASHENFIPGQPSLKKSTRKYSWIDLMGMLGGWCSMVSWCSYKFRYFYKEDTTLTMSITRTKEKTCCY